VAVVSNSSPALIGSVLRHVAAEFNASARTCPVYAAPWLV